MYCSSCGADLAQGLSYCNRCGASLASSELLIVDNKSKLIFFPISLGILMIPGIVVGGITLVFLFVMEFFRKGLPIEAIMILAISAILTLFVTAGLLSRQISRLINAYLASGESQNHDKPKLNARQPIAEIPAPLRMPVTSVTEHTTRTLDPIYQEPKIL